MNFTKIVNPVDGKSYSIFNREGRRVLKNYIRFYKRGGYTWEETPASRERSYEAGRRWDNEELARRDAKTMRDMDDSLVDAMDDMNTISTYKKSNEGKPCSLGGLGKKINANSCGPGLKCSSGFGNRKCEKE